VRVVLFFSFLELGDRYEAGISLARNYDVELVKHISDKSNELVEQEIHLNTWLLERGLARRDTRWSSKCKEPEHLVWAENIAREDFLGQWVVLA
jgi:hypothetical protein